MRCEIEYYGKTLKILAENTESKVDGLDLCGVVPPYFTFSPLTPFSVFIYCSDL